MPAITDTYSLDIVFIGLIFFAVAWALVRLRLLSHDNADGFAKLVGVVIAISYATLIDLKPLYGEFLTFVVRVCFSALVGFIAWFVMSFVIGFALPEKKKSDKEAD